MSYMKDASGRRLDGLRASSPTLETLTPPTALGWDSTLLNVQAKVGSEISTAGAGGGLVISPEAAFDTFSTCRTAPVNTYYVDAAAAGGGTGTSGSPFQTIRGAIQAANTAGQTAKIIVKAGTYWRQAVLSPTVDIAFIASGGRVDMTTGDQFTAPSLDATYTNCYSYAVTNVGHVLDMKDRDRFGNYVELARVDTAAKANATPNSWALVSGTIYINRADGVPVTNLTTRVLRITAVCYQQSNAVNVYFGGSEAGSGFDMTGGDQAACDLYYTTAQTTRKAFVAVDCSFSFAGFIITKTTSTASASLARGFSGESFGGLIYLARCRADANPTDGFNFHNSYGSTIVQPITVNCSAHDNGRYGQGSCNGWTTHDTVVGIDIAGHYRGNHGGSVASVNASKSWLVGTHIEDDYGDIHMGTGTLLPTAVYVRDTAEYWMERVKITMPAGNGRAYVTLTSTAKIHRRNCQPVRQADVGPGTFDTF